MAYFPFTLLQQILDFLWDYKVLLYCPKGGNFNPLIGIWVYYGYTSSLRGQTGQNKFLAKLETGRSNLSQVTQSILQMHKTS